MNFVINIEEQKEREKDRVLEVELVRTIISLHNLSHDIDYVQVNSLWLQIQPAWKLRGWFSVTSSRERERGGRSKEWWRRTCGGRRRLIIQRRVILPIRSNYSRRRIKDRSFSACLFAGDLDTGTRRLVLQAVFAFKGERFLRSTWPNRTIYFDSRRVFKATTPTSAV